MRVFLNAVLLTDLPSGGNRRMLELVRRLPACLPEADVLVGVNRRYADRLDLGAVETVPMRSTADYRLRGTLARAVTLKHEVTTLCRRLGADLCHLFSLPPFRVRGVRTVLTLQDNRYLRFPAHYGRSRYAANLLLRGKVAAMDAVITVSEAMRDEIRRLYGAERVYVVPNGVTPPGRRWEPDRDSPYFATVLRREPRKGLDVLLRAVEGAGGSLRLVVIGCEGASAAGVRFAGLVSDRERERLIAGATGFVFPSVYEGFGIPPLEAQAMGVPVIAARASAMPEVLGEAALFVVPADAEGLRRTMLHLLGDAALQARLSAAGVRNAARYDWDSAARALARAYRDVLRVRP